MPAGDEGLLWRTDALISLQKSLEVGLAYHLKKFGKPAEFAEFHPDTLAGNTLQAEGVEICTDQQRLKNEIFIGTRRKK